MTAQTRIWQGLTLAATVGLLFLIAFRLLLTVGACAYVPDSEKPLIPTGLFMAVVPPLLILLVGGYIALGRKHVASRAIGMAFVLALAGFVFVWLGLLSMWCG